MYPEELTTPMIAELTGVGFTELKTPVQVDEAFKLPGTTLCVINSVCGCAAGTCRPGVTESLSDGKRPDRMVTVFAGVDNEATMQARNYFLPYPPSSPSIALMKDGKLVHFVERHHIEGRSAAMIAEHLKTVYDEFC